MVKMDQESMSEMLKSLDLSAKETTRLNAAFKDPEFLKLFEQYARDVSSPEASYEQDCYLRQLEAETGVESVYGKNMQLVVPKEEFVVKTKTKDGKKVFINICSSEKLKPASMPAKAVPEGRQGGFWDIPFALGSLYDSADKQGVPSKGVDFVVHPQTIELSRTNVGFYNILMETAIEQLNEGNKLGLSNHVTKLKMKYKATEGRLRPGVLSIRSDSNSSENSTQKQSNCEETCGKQECKIPPYKLVYLHEMDLSQTWSDLGRGLVDDHGRKPKGVRIEVVLDKVKSLSEISLDIKDKLFHLNVHNRHELQLDLLANVDESKTTAEFNSKTKTLKATLTFKSEPLAPELSTCNRDLRVSTDCTDHINKDSSSCVSVGEDTPDVDPNQSLNPSEQSIGESDSNTTKRVLECLTPNEKKWKEIHEEKDSVLSSLELSTIQRKEEIKKETDNSLDLLLKPNLDFDSILSID